MIARSCSTVGGEDDNLWIGRVPYGPPERAWLNRQDHYLHNAVPGALFAVAVQRAVRDLVGGVVGEGQFLGLCVVGRPTARRLPQDGSVGEVTRFFLTPGLPYGIASRVLRHVASIAQRRGMVALIAYHDRTRHSGCIYRKAGFHKDGGHNGVSVGWQTRQRVAGEVGSTPKRRWRLDLR